ncbi:MAG: phosphate ABC transporter substrate-binding protein [Actinomycetota bacterium]|jgi:phosphate transport system substrate-binding protein|nr:phosphate ABC transporter substrate-binding protein [Actinomycetota bacterium]
MSARFHSSSLMILMALLLVVGLLGATGCSSADEGVSAEEAETAEPIAEASPLDVFAEFEGELDIAGGTAHIPVMEAVAADVMESNDVLLITVAGGGSGVGVQQVGEGLVEIGNAGRAVKGEELEAYPGLVSFAFAVDGVAAVVHPDNPVTEVTAEQMQAIFAGEITDWAEVGGNAGEIHVFTRDESSGTREVFWEKALAEGDIVVEANVVASNGAMKTAVSEDAQAIGFMGIGGIDDSVVGVSYDGVVPTQDNAKDGSYMVTRKLYMNTLGEPEGLTKAFIDFIMGAEGVPYIVDGGYIPIF